MSYSGHTWAVDGLDPVLLCAVVGEGFEVHGLEVALGALVFDFPVDGVDVVVDRPTELRLEVTKAEISTYWGKSKLKNLYYNYNIKALNLGRGQKKYEILGSMKILFTHERKSMKIW